MGEQGNMPDPTYNWYIDPRQYDPSWYNQDLTQQGYANTSQQQGYVNTSQLALPPPPQESSSSAQAINFVEEVLIAGIEDHQGDSSSRTSSFEEIMIDSAAAAHICPPWFGTSFPLHHLEDSSTPQLRTVTDNNIYVYGYRWIHFVNQRSQHIVIPFYVCDVKHPILSVTRLIHQGLEINLKDNSTMTHQKSFESHITQRDGLLYIHLKQAPVPPGHQLSINETTRGQIAMIAPTTMTRSGPQPMRGGNTDTWMFNNEGYIVRVHKRLRRAMFTPHSTDCPIDPDQLEDYRKTIIKQPGKPTAEVINSFRDTTQKNNRLIDGPAWIGETWFKPKQGASTVIKTKPATAKMIETEHASTAPNKHDPRASSTPQAAMKANIDTQAPLMRATGKQPARYSSIPDPSQVERTSDYWIREGRLWKRVHIIPRNTLYRPEATDGGPSPDDLTSTRVTFIKPTNGSRPHRIDDEWTTEPQPRQSTSWTGSTNFEEKATFNQTMKTISKLSKQEQQRHQSSQRNKKFRNTT